MLLLVKSIIYNLETSSGSTESFEFLDTQFVIGMSPGKMEESVEFKTTTSYLLIG